MATKKTPPNKARLFLVPSLPTATSIPPLPDLESLRPEELATMLNIATTISGHFDALDDASRDALFAELIGAIEADDMPRFAALLEPVREALELQQWLPKPRKKAAKKTAKKTATKKKAKPAKAPGATTTTYHDFEIELLHHEPRSWRRFLMKSTARLHLGDLHDAIQIAAGWNQSHLAAFCVNRKTPVAQLMDDDSGYDTSPTFTKVKVADAFADTNTLLYNYDFGDDWWVRVKHKRYVERDGDDRRVFVDAVGAFPPDDCGGIGGFEDLLALFAKKKTKARLTADERERLAWVGDWSPEVNLERLARAFSLTRTGNYWSRA